MSGLEDVHLLATENKTLLDRRNTLLLFDALLYPRNLTVSIFQFTVLEKPRISLQLIRRRRKQFVAIERLATEGSHLVVWLNIQLYLLAGKCADPMIRSSVSNIASGSQYGGDSMMQFGERTADLELT